MKNDKTKISRKDIYVYAEIMDEPILREGKDYIIAGCYNEDKTKFENLLTGEIYDCNVGNLDTDKLNVKDRMFSILEDDEIMPAIFEIYWTQILKTKYKGDFNWFNIAYYIQNSVSKRPISLKYKNIYDFFIRKKGDSKVELAEVKKVVNKLNKSAHKQISKELEKNQTHSL